MLSLPRKASPPGLGDVFQKETEGQRKFRLDGIESSCLKQVPSQQVPGTLVWPRRPTQKQQQVLTSPVPANRWLSGSRPNQRGGGDF
jgi:hypothetical protein